MTRAIHNGGDRPLVESDGAGGHEPYVRVGAGLPVSVVSVTIPNGAGGISASVDLRGLAVVRIVMPATWVAAALTFQGSDDNAAFANLYTAAGVEYSLTVAQGNRVMVPLSDLLGNSYVKFRSGTAALAVNQTADRVLSLVCWVL